MSVVPIGIDAESDASLLAHDDTFYGHDEHDAGAAEAEWSDSDSEGDISSTSILRHGSELNLGDIVTLQSRDAEVNDVDETIDID